jgi:hypothetical protein
MLTDVRVMGGHSYGKTTQNANTIITQLVAPFRNAYTAITFASYTAAGTAHTLTAMRPFNYTTFTADAAASQAVVNITANPGAYSTTGVWQYGRPGITPSTANNLMAASDFVAYELPDGNYVLDTVSSISSLAVTLTTNLPTGGVKKGGRLWFYGIITDVNPQTSKAHPQFTLTASVTTTFENEVGEFFRSLNTYDPIILHSGNATAAGTLDRVSVLYLKN